MKFYSNMLSNPRGGLPPPEAGKSLKNDTKGQTIFKNAGFIAKPLEFVMLKC